MYFSANSSAITNMDHELLNLKWEQDKLHLQQLLLEIKESDVLSYVTLVSDDHTEHKIHKIVLNTFSPLIKRIFSNHPEESTRIYLTSIKHEYLESIIKLMYLGETFIDKKDVHELKEIAKLLELKEFKIEGNFLQPIVYMKKEQGCFEVKGEVLNSPKKEEIILNKKVLIYPKQEENKRKKSTICKICNKKFTLLRNLKTHIESVHDKIKFPCLQCEKQFTQKIHLKEHTNAFHGDVTFDCKYCKKQFKHRKARSNHIKLIHEGVNYPCNQCEFVSLSKNGLTYHIQVKHEDAKYFCDECDQNFSLKATLAFHIESVHRGVKYECNQCSYNSKRKSQLQKHIKFIHSGIEKQNFICDICDYFSTWKERLKDHIQAIHIGSNIHVMIVTIFLNICYLPHARVC